MTDKEYVNVAKEFLTVSNFYEYGGWGQEMTMAVLNSLAERYPKNKPVNPANVGKWGFDCICWLKGMLAGVNIHRHINDYNTFKKACPIGDCTNVEFMNMLYDCVDPKDAKAGYGLATKDHAALALGNGQWMDANRTAGQDGIAIHTTGIENFTKCGKIPGITYTAPESDDVKDFLSWLYYCWKERKNLYE